MDIKTKAQSDLNVLLILSCFRLCDDTQKGTSITIVQTKSSFTLAKPMNEITIIILLFPTLRIKW